MLLFNPNNSQIIIQKEPIGRYRNKAITRTFEKQNDKKNRRKKEKRKHKQNFTDNYELETCFINN